MEKNPPLKYALANNCHHCGAEILPLKTRVYTCIRENEPVTSVDVASLLYGEDVDPRTRYLVKKAVQNLISTQHIKSKSGTHNRRFYEINK